MLSVEEEIGEGGFGSDPGGGEWTRRAPGRLQAKEGGTGRPGRLSAATWRPRLARWLSTEQLGCTGRGRRPSCPWWASWAGCAASPMRKVSVLLLFLLFLFCNFV